MNPPVATLVTVGPNGRRQPSRRPRTGAQHQRVGDLFGANGVFWCAEFVSWVFADAGHPLPISIGASKSASGYAYCQYGRDAAYQRGELYSRLDPETCSSTSGAATAVPGIPGSWSTCCPMAGS